MSHLEFACDLSTLFDCWCTAAEVDSNENLSNLIILEQFKNSVLEGIAVHVCEHKVRTATEAATLADDYILSHGSVSWHSGQKGGNGQKGKSSFGCIVWMVCKPWGGGAET